MEWYDVSDVIARCASTLSTSSSSSVNIQSSGNGQCSDGGRAASMLHAEEFSLYESMSAVEIMDPRMDAGASGKKLPTVSEMIRAGHAPSGLSAARLCAVMDRMICCELAWYRGNTLAQTVLTCLYLADGGVDRADDEFVFAAVEGYRATCARVLDFVQVARVFEEEDFVDIRYGGGLHDNSASRGVRQGVTLGDGGGAAAAQAAEGPIDEQLEAVISRLERVRDGILASDLHPSPGGGLVSDDAHRKQLLQLPLVRELIKERRPGVTDDDSGPAIGEQIAEECAPCIDALIHRMRLRRALYKVFKMISSAASLSPAAGATKKLPLEAIRRELSSALAALRAVYDTRELSGDCVGFDENVSRRMLGPAVVRSTTILAVPDALLGMRSMLESMITACDACSCTSLAELHDFLEDFCSSDVGAVPRSLAWLIVKQDDNMWLLRLIFDALVVPPAKCADERAFREFVCDSAQDPVLMLMRATCSNPGRQRRMIRQTFHLWAEMFTIANDLDNHEEARAAAATSDGFQGTWWGEHFALAWVQDTVIKQQISFLMHGFTLELYCANEYSMIYWYLDFLIGRLIHGMELMRTSVEKAMQAEKDRSEDESRVEGSEARNMETLRMLTFNIFIWTAKRLLCQGAVRILSGVMMSQELCPSVYTLEDEFNTETERYRQRFECFQTLPHPPLIGHEEYLKGMKSEGHSTSDLLALALPCYTQAREILSQLGGLLQPLEGTPAASESPSLKLFHRRRQEVLQMQRVAMTNSIATNVLLRRCESSDGKSKVSFEFESSKHFFTVCCKT